MSTEWKTRYGTWAVVAGASEGLGAAFAASLAARGQNLILIARRAPVLETLAQELRARHNVEIRTIAADLSDARFAEALRAAAEELEIGVGVYNAAYSVMGPLLEHSVEEALQVVDVNCRGPLRFVHALAPAMVRRQRGALVLMSSQAGFQGVPTIATYAASKAFNIVLGEGLWAELKEKGIDVLVSCAGAIRTPNYKKTMTKEAPGALDPEEVAEQTLHALGKTQLITPGAVNKLARFFLGRLLPRATAIRIIGDSTRAAAAAAKS
jgi:short-subunit dehydrogenase